MALRDSAFVAGKSDEGKVIDKKKTPVKSALASLRSAFEVDCITSVRKYHLEIEHLIVQKLAKTCDEIITLASADPEHINLQELVAKMEEYEKRLRLYSEESGPRHIFEKIFGTDANGGCHHKEFTPAEQQAIVDLYAPKIRAAAADALAIYDKYKKGTKAVPGILKSLEHRLMYDQRCDPRPLPTDLCEYKEFFGCLPSDDTALLEMEYRDWLDARKKLTTVEKAMPMVHYWSQPSVKAKFPSLAKLAVWYSNRPTSNDPTWHARERLL